MMKKEIELRKQRDRHKAWRILNVNHIRDYHKRKYQELKDLIFSLLGNKCNSCFCSDLRVLQIDHVNDDGYKEHRLMGTGWQYLRQVLKAIRTGSKRYQLLCANCNVIKRLEAKRLKGGTR